MPRNRIIYNVQGVFIGPAPATGYHIMDNYGVFCTGNNGLLSGDYQNLVFPLHRINSFDYSISAARTKVYSLGKMGTAANVMIEPPSVSLSFSYLNFNPINEVRMGFYINHYDSGQAFPDNYNVCLISGFLTRQDGSDSSLGWPKRYRDCRNIFVGIARDNQDLNTDVYGVSGRSDVDTLGFGNCYLTSYRTSASVGAFPQTTVSYIAEHMSYNSGADNIMVPAIDPRTYSGAQQRFSLPSMFDSGNYASVILPGDIKVNISGLDSYLGTTSSSMSLQSYEWSMDLNRLPLTNLGYTAPMDRVINLPVFVNLSFEAMINDVVTGSIGSFFANDNHFNIDISGSNRNSLKVVYAFRKSKLNSVSFRDGIGANKTARFDFETEIDPQDLSKGLFISGVLGLNSSAYVNLLQFDALAETGYLLFENGDRILLESARRFIY
jgi:hypothetical protein